MGMNVGDFQRACDCVVTKENTCLKLCNAVGRKCSEVVENLFITVDKNYPKVADKFLNCFHLYEQKLSARHFLCPRQCRHVAVFLSLGVCASSQGRH